MGTLYNSLNLPTRPTWPNFSTAITIIILSLTLFDGGPGEQEYIFPVQINSDFTC